MPELLNPAMIATIHIIIIIIIMVAASSNDAPHKLWPVTVHYTSPRTNPANQNPAPDLPSHKWQGEYHAQMPWMVRGRGDHLINSMTVAIQSDTKIMLLDTVIANAIIIIVRFLIAIM